ncbi:unnamed protein product, partial [Dibothriocephalus latus]
DSGVSTPTSTWNIRFGHILPLQSPEFAAGQETTFEVDLRGSGEPVASTAKHSIFRRRTNPAAGDIDPADIVSPVPDLKDPSGDSEVVTEADTICPDAARCLSELTPFGAKFRLSCTIRPSTAEEQATTVFAANEDIREGYLFVFFFLHRKFNHLTLLNYDEGVVHMPSPEFRFKVSENQRIQSLQDRLGYESGNRQTHERAFYLLVDGSVGGQVHLEIEISDLEHLGMPEPAEQEAVQIAQTSTVAALPAASPASDVPKALPVETLASRSESNAAELPPHIDPTNALARTYDQFSQYPPPPQQYMRGQPQLNYPQPPYGAPQAFYGPWMNAENYVNPLPVVYEPLNPRQFSIPPFIPGVLGQAFACPSTTNAIGLSRLAYARIYSSGEFIA